MADMSYFDFRPKVFEEIAEQVSDRFIDAETIQFITCESIIEIDRYIGLPIFFLIFKHFTIIWFFFFLNGFEVLFFFHIHNYTEYNQQ